MPYPAQFGGIVPPVSTPFDLDGDVDVVSLERLLNYLLEGGVSGIFALGSTSETGALSDDQRRLILDTTIQTVAGQVPVIAGVIDMSTARAIDHARVAAQLGADAIVACGPYYIKPNDDEIIEHFHHLRDAVDLRMLAYNIPQLNQTELDTAVLAQLAEEGTIVGMKDSSGNEPRFRATVAACRHLPDFAIFTGSELTSDYALLAGAHGIVPGLGNVDPVGYRRLYDHAAAKNWDAVREEQERLAKLFAITAAATPGRVGPSAAAWGGFKTALREMGVIATNIMATPMLPLDEEETRRIRTILEDVDLI